MRHIKDTRQYSRHERPQIADTDSRTQQTAEVVSAGRGLHAATTLCACGQARACLFFCTHARKACINGLLSASRGKEPTADVKTVCPGSRSRCPQEQHKQGPRHVRLQVLHFVLPNASASHMQAHSHIVGHERTQPGHQTRESVRRAPPVRSHAGPLSSDCGTLLTMLTA